MQLSPLTHPKKMTTVCGYPGCYSFTIMAILSDTPDEYDDGFTAGSSTKIPDVVVFSDSRQKPSEQFSKAQKKAFMASLMYCHLRVLIQE